MPHQQSGGRAAAAALAGLLHLFDLRLEKGADLLGGAGTARDMVLGAALVFFGVVALTALYAPREYSDRAFRLLDWMKPAAPQNNGGCRGESTAGFAPLFLDRRFVR
ncbi:hypothetical protein [Streptomyces sp. NPDC002250]|uniref:hypothetical protein n=1 Tax=Streptomyces sp. NPDC002250 TaxID=3364641 RepID=UPI003698F024